MPLYFREDGLKTSRVSKVTIAEMNPPCLCFHAGAMCHARLRIMRSTDGDARRAQTDAAGGEEEELSNLTLAERRERDSGARDGECAVPNFTKRGRVSRLWGRLCRGHPWGRTRSRLRFVSSGK